MSDDVVAPVRREGRPRAVVLGASALALCCLIAGARADAQAGGLSGGRPGTGSG